MACKVAKVAHPRKNFEEEEATAHHPRPSRLLDGSQPPEASYMQLELSRVLSRYSLELPHRPSYGSRADGVAPWVLPAPSWSLGMRASLSASISASISA